MTDRIEIVTMPKWGMTMTEGRVAAWLKAPGDRIESGDDFVEVETDKITNVVEAQVAGLLRRILVQAGQSAACGAPIAILAEADVPEAEIDAIADATPVAVVAEAGLVETRVDAGGMSLNVISAGTGDAPPLILLHGFGSDAASWMFVQEPLADGRKVHAIDLPSHGASDVDAAVATVEALAERLRVAIDALAPGPLHLAGHSLGGRLALALAADMGTRVLTLTLVAPAGMGGAVNPAFVQGFLTADKRRPMKEALQMLVADEGAVTSDMVERALAVKRMDGATAALTAIAAACLGSAATDGDTVDRDGVTAPVLLIWGAEDRVIPPPETGATLIPDAGHIPQMEAATTVAQMIARHIAAAP
jgi:pyruvate dehydrogenase E2 component (dihydrolipoamide acetyltransferase)